MATLYISEYSEAGIKGPGMLPAAAEPGVTTQTVAISGTTAQSAAFGATTRFVRVHTDAICSIAFGSNPTATTSKLRMAANQTEYFAVRPGDKVAVISNT